MDIIRAAVPEADSYVDESGCPEPHWQRSFWGENCPGCWRRGRGRCKTWMIMSRRTPLICNVSSVTNVVLLPFRVVMSNLPR
jgi:hypothetical protein